MARRPGLGRGLDALISSDENLPAGRTLQLPIDRILPNPRQPRDRFDPAELGDLAASIRQYGILQPLIVTQDDAGGQYTLIAGERRLMAARQAGLESVPVIIREAGEQQRLELALIENLQRADLDPLEAAEAFRQLVDDFGLSHDEVSSRVGKSRTAVTNTLRLLKLPASVQQALIEKLISEGHARALLGLPNAQAQAAALQVILSKNLNVRQVEELVRRLNGQRSASTPKASAPPEITALEERLMAHLGTRVKLNRKRNGGTLVIHYYSNEELDSLLETLLRENTAP